MNVEQESQLRYLAAMEAERISAYERKLVETSAGSRGRLIAGFEAQARYLALALRIELKDARNHCDAQLAWLEDEPEVDPLAFELETFNKVFALAMGESPAPVSQVDRAVRRVEKALASRQMVVNVAQQPINITLPAPQVSVSVAAPAPTPAPRQERPWPTRTTIVKRDREGRANVIETAPIDD